MSSVIPVVDVCTGSAVNMAEANGAKRSVEAKERHLVWRAFYLYNKKTCSIGKKRRENMSWQHLNHVEDYRDQWMVDGLLLFRAFLHHRTKLSFTDGRRAATRGTDLRMGSILAYRVLLKDTLMSRQAELWIQPPTMKTTK